jgi:phosphopantothenoylcysteine decarboxylase/phosphopantothenate--cysteine ligase
MSASATIPAAPPARILLGITGSIAAYKAAMLARLLAKAGTQVQTVMTASARQFVGPATFQALTGRPVRDSLWDEQAEAAMGHIELARWADAIVIAPATADFLARLAHGLADDLLSTLCLATDRPLFVAPAMNRLMWAHPATQANMVLLRSRGVNAIGPGSGDQACGETGEGRMAEPEEIAARLLRPLAAAQPGALAGVRAVVTAGPTREAIDPVRFLSNRSSGKQGFAVAEALANLGAAVTLVSGPVQLPSPAAVQRVDVETAQQMLDATLAAAAGAQMLVGVAAVADYRPAAPAMQKIKRASEALQLTLVRNPDILAGARERNPGLFIVGFAAETDDLERHAAGKLKAKGLDMIAANWVNDGRAFERDDNALRVFWSGGEAAFGPAAKSEIAAQLAALIAQQYRLSVRKNS